MESALSESKPVVCGETFILVYGNQYAEITLSLLMTFCILYVSYVYHMHCSNLALFSSSQA